MELQEIRHPLKSFSSPEWKVRHTGHKPQTGDWRHPMENLRSRTRVVGALLVAGFAFVPLVAWAHVETSSHPTRNRVKAQWNYPCTSTMGGDTLVVATPPNNATLVRADQDPNDSNNAVFVHAVAGQTEEFSDVFVYGCTVAGRDRIEAQTLERPWARVSLGPASPSPAPQDSIVHIAIERIVTPGVIPDLVRVTFLSGGLQARAVDATQWATATLKLIVYPDLSTADADRTLAGVGSAFFGAVTLAGGSGALTALQGFSIGDFLVNDIGGGQFTAIPVTGLSELAEVPDANIAVVSLVGDPRANPAGTTGVPGDGPLSGVWLGRAVPNPAHGDTRIGFGIPRPGRVSLEIYDQQGRRVRELVRGNLPAGQHEARWDGRDVGGRRVSSGLYFYRLDADGRRLTGKVFALR